MTRPTPIHTHDNPFAFGTMKDRVPGILRETAAQVADPAAAAALRQLADEMTADAVLPALTHPAPDYAAWMAAYLPRDGETWLHTQWWFAELYTYRLIIEHTRWYETGIDPFAHKKAAELASPALWDALYAVLPRAADGVAGTPIYDGSLAETEDTDATRRARLLHLLAADLWGNRIDLSLESSKAHGTTASADDLLADDRAAALDHLLAVENPVVHLVADNTGSELALDLALIDALLDGVCPQVILHVKAHPTFVSDAIPADVSTLIAHMAERRRTPFQHLADRLNAALLDQRLIVRPHWLWNSPYFLFNFPADFIAEQFSGAGDDSVAAALVIVKGDANYRRMVGDAIWSADVPFTQVMAYFPAPLLALRTLKSDPVVGLPAGMATTLDAADPAWRVNGKRGVIQLHLPR